MPGRRKHRNCRTDTSGLIYKPKAVPFSKLQTTILQLDEFEAMRLCDHENLDQSEAGLKMGVSRGTIQRLLDSGRKKMISAMLARNSIQLESLPSCCKKRRCPKSVGNEE
jgi:predicted DNA-binding protein (UPF0251 family)